MTKHTPGPWVAEPGGGRGAWIMGANREWTALACGDTDESANANARLIAAAPELLEALKVAQIWLDLDGRYDMRGINAAIEKATGEAP